jgi:hypothetical protein
MPVLGTPPCVVGVVDAAMLPEPEPHMADMPDVSISADVGGTPDDDVDMAGIEDPGTDIEPCGITVPTATPPPSNVFVDPNIVDGAVPMVEHVAVPNVPVGEAGDGLIPGEAISVAPSGMPVGPTGALGNMASGVVADREGVGITAACCAMAEPHSRAEAAAIVRYPFMVLSNAGQEGAMDDVYARCVPSAVFRKWTGALGENRPGPVVGSTAVERPGAMRVPVVEVVAIGIEVAEPSPAVAMQGVLMESEAAVCARSDVAFAKAAHAADMRSCAESAKMFAAETADVAAKTAADSSHVSSAPEAAAKAATAAGLSRARQQARSQKSRCNYRDQMLHRVTPSSLPGAATRELQEAAPAMRR